MDAFMGRGDIPARPWRLAGWGVTQSIENRWQSATDFPQNKIGNKLAIYSKSMAICPGFATGQNWKIK
jgi:hypothetical protein